MTYKVFISYSHAADDKLAPALQSALHRFAKPFYRLRAIRVFRDKTSLRLTPELWPLIQRAIVESEYFLLLASPAAAKSQWVQDEIAEWLKLRGGAADKILLVLTDGRIEWDDTAGDFDWTQTDALPPNLRGVFRHEPLYSDLRWARKAIDLSLRNPQFLDEIGSLGATLHGKSKDEMIGADVRQHRFFKAITAVALVLLLALTAAATSTAFYAVRQKNEAQRQTAEAQKQKTEAERQRQSAIEAAEREAGARQKEESQRRKAEQATLNEKVAKDQAEERRRDAERQRLLADERRAEAERERKVATARELAASAVSLQSSDPELGLLLSLEACERTLTAESEDALRQSLVRSRVRATFRGNMWYSVTYSPGGEWVLLREINTSYVVDTRTWRIVTNLLGGARWHSILDLSVDRDGKRLLTIGYGEGRNEYLLRLWDTGTWHVVSELKIESKYNLFRLKLSPDGRLGAVQSDALHWVRVYDLATGEFVSLPYDQNSSRLEMAFTPDNRPAVLTYIGDGVGAVRVWGAAAEQMLSAPDCNPVIDNGMTLSPDGKYMTLLCWEGKPRVIDLATGAVVAELSDHGGHLTGGLFSPDSKWMVTFGSDRTARVRETGTWRDAAVLRGHTGDVEDVKFSGDGNILLTAGADGTVRAWEVGTWRALAILRGHTRSIESMGISPDGRHVVTISSDSTARAWELDAGGGGVVEIEGSSESEDMEDLPTVYSPDGRFVVTMTTTGFVEVWEPSLGGKVADLGQGNFLAFSSDGKYALTSRSDFAVLMWETRTWQKRVELRGHTSEVVSVAFSPDGKLVATAGAYDETLRIWEVGTGRSVNVLHGAESAWYVVFSPDGKWLGTARTGETACIWEVSTWRKVAELGGHTGEVQVIAFSRDGSRLVTASRDNTARVWEAGTWRPRAVLRGHTDWIGNAEFSPDGRYIVTASSDDTARLWDAETGNMIAVLDGHANIVNSAHFSPDGRLIATGGGETVRLWEAETGLAVRVIHVLPADSVQGVNGVIFSPDGKSLLASGSDGVTRIYTWELFAPLKDLITLARTRVTRALTSEEKKKYLHQEAGEREGRAQ